MSTPQQPRTFKVADPAEAMRKAHELAGRVMQVPKSNVDKAVEEEAKKRPKRRTA